MNTFFTLVKKSCTKNTGFISRILWVSLKNRETREISCVDIRDMEPKTGVKNNTAALASGGAYFLPPSGPIRTYSSEFAAWATFPCRLPKQSRSGYPSSVNRVVETVRLSLRLVYIV